MRTSTLAKSAVLFSLVIVAGIAALVLPPSQQAPPAQPTPSATPVPGLQPAIDAGVAFLKQQYNPDYGLLQESPTIGHHRYYLTNDNALAAYVFEHVGEGQMADGLRKTIDQYGTRHNNFIEVAWGEKIPWPPLHHKDVVSEQLGDGECDFLNEEEAGALSDCILQETHTPDLGVFYDWSSFSNLHCMGAINEYNKGNFDVALWLYRTELSTFDGRGWADEAWLRRDGVYETLGVAWCLYAGAVLDEPVNDEVLSALLDQQDPVSGGFHTHYRAGEPRLADPNVETTSVALLALLTLARDHDLPPSRLGLPDDAGKPNP